MDVLALFGWRTCRETPFKNSFSSASLPTRCSTAAMRASYSASTSAAAVLLSSPPASVQPPRETAWEGQEASLMGGPGGGYFLREIGQLASAAAPSSYHQCALPNFVETVK